MSDFFSNQEIANEALAHSVSQRIFELASSNNHNLKTIAEMLGATRYLTLEEVGKGYAPVWRLDVRGFIGDLKQSHQLHDLSMPKDIVVSNSIILPPDHGELFTGSGRGIEAKKIIPRSRYLIEVLTGLGLSYSVHEGQNTPNMMRGLSYQAFVIPQVNKIIFINNEEGNATFLVHDIMKDDVDGELQFYTALTKDQLKALGPEKVSVVQFDKTPDQWKEEITRIIMEGAPIRPIPDAIPTFNHELPQSIPDSLKIKPTERNEESAIKELEQAFDTWKQQDEKKRGKFNISWLDNNGYSALRAWSRREGHISIVDLVAKSQNKELQNSFDIQSQSQPYTEALAIAKLIEAFNKWASLPKKERGLFNTFWLKEHGYGGLYNWSKKNTSFVDLVVKTGNKRLKRAFKKEKKSQPYTEAFVIVKLIEAFKKWKALPADNRGDFNVKWMSKNGYKGLYSWSLDHILIPNLVKKINNKELHDAFERREVSEPLTATTAVNKFVEAFEKWTALPADGREDFNRSWLRRNGYEGLYKWRRRHGISFAELAVTSGNSELIQALK